MNGSPVKTGQEPPSLLWPNLGGKITGAKGDRDEKDNPGIKRVTGSQPVAEYSKPHLVKQTLEGLLFARHYERICRNTVSRWA